MNVIIKKNTGTNRVIETPVESFINRDSAVLKCAVLNRDEVRKDTTYHLVDIRHEDENSIEAERINGELFIFDSYDNKIIVDVKLERIDDELPFHEEVAPEPFSYYRVESISIYGTDIDQLGLSKDLVRDIKNQADNLADEYTKESDDAL